MTETHPGDDMGRQINALADRFQARAAEDREALSTAVRQNDTATLRDIAHRLAGLAPMFGFTDVGNCARALEDAVDGGGGADRIAASADALIDALARPS